MKMEDLNGKVAVLVGCGIETGESIARKLFENGVKLVACDLRDDIVNFIEEIKKDYPGAEGYGKVFNATVEAEAKNLVDEVVEKYGTIDIMIYHAGMVVPAAFIEEACEADYDKTFAVNTKGPMFMMKHTAPLMKAKKDGCMIITSSWFGRKGVPQWGPYCASKAAVISLVQTVALELAEYGVRVNTIAPGDIENGLHLNAIGKIAEKIGITFEEMNKKVLSAIPMGKRAEGDDLANAVLYLASKEASGHVTAITLNVSGGCEFR
jgi:NAD(P)-dependent dehydrogenase (short-subunit alcohol dehydrogenase family)